MNDNKSAKDSKSGDDVTRRPPTTTASTCDEKFRAALEQVNARYGKALKKLAQ